MTTRATLGRLATVAAIAILAAAVSMVWVVSGSRAFDQDGGVPLGWRIAQAAAEDVPLDGTCFGSGNIDIATPDPDELSRMVQQKSRNARLEAATEAAPDAHALADRTGGEFVALRGDEAYVLHVANGSRRVLTYTRYRSSAGDSVWIVTGTKMKIPCHFKGD